MIEVRDLRFQYGQSDFQLRVPELTLEQGSTTAIIGPSGSGKTTLLHLIAGILQPDSGSVSISDTVVSSLNESHRREYRAKQLGLVFQEFELLDHLSVMDNILLTCRFVPSERITSDHRERASELAEKMGIRNKLPRYVRKLSQGERQRVALCRALLLSPPVLLCDEPTGNLDPANKDSVLDILFEYVDDNDTTLVTVTHDHQMLPRFDATIDFQAYHRLDGVDG